MIYDRKPCYGDGQWHCPFPPEWVDRMARAAKCCKQLPAEYIESAIDSEVYSYRVPPGDFLKEEQDARGLPLSWCREYEARHEGWPECCVATYNYDTLPEIEVTNGENDWPLIVHIKILTA